MTNLESILVNFQVKGASVSSVNRDAFTTFVSYLSLEDRGIEEVIVNYGDLSALSHVLTGIFVMIFSLFTRTAGSPMLKLAEMAVFSCGMV